MFVGEYDPVTASMDDKNYSAADVQGTFTIEQGSDTYITLAEMPDVYYGTPPLDLGLRASTGNRVMVFVAGPAEIGNDKNRLVTVNDVGTVDILLYALGAGIPAEQRFQAASFEVKKRPLLITADNKSRTYGSGNPDLTYSVQGFASGEDESVFSTGPALTTTADKSSGVGGVAITFSTEAVDGTGHYAISHQPGNLTVSKAPLIITGGDQTRKYGPVETSFFSGKQYVNQGSDATRSRSAAAAVLYVEGDTIPEGKAVGDVKTAAVDAVTFNHWRVFEVTSSTSANMTFYLDEDLSTADNQANFLTISRDDFVWDATTRNLAAPTVEGSGIVFGLPYTSSFMDVTFNDSFTQATLVFTGNLLETTAGSPEITAQLQGFAATFSNIDIVGGVPAVAATYEDDGVTIKNSSCSSCAG